MKPSDMQPSLAFGTTEEAPNWARRAKELHRAIDAGRRMAEQSPQSESDWRTYTAGFAAAIEQVFGLSVEIATRSTVTVLGDCRFTFCRTGLVLLLPCVRCGADIHYSAANFDEIGAAFDGELDVCPHCAPLPPLDIERPSYSILGATPVARMVA